MTLKTARRLVVLVFGSTILLLGVVMLVTPGPGIVGILAGLTILATEFVWARTLLERAKDGAEHAKSKLFDAARVPRCKRDIISAQPRRQSGSQLVRTSTYENSHRPAVQLERMP